MIQKDRRTPPVATIPDEPPQLLERLADCRRADTQSFADAWIGLEPTFSDARMIRRWRRLGTDHDEYAFYWNDKVLRRQKGLARAIEQRYRKLARQGDPACPFPEVERRKSKDPWGIRRQDFTFRDPRTGAELEVRLGLDPETFEFGVKPVPLAWFYDPRFVAFLQRFVWDVPAREGLGASMAHGGGQFCFSAKTFLQGSLLADHLAWKLNHPELASWTLDFPNPDDRAFRATRARFRAFRDLVERYWKGAFHPASLGTLRVQNAILDRGFGPACNPEPDRMDPRFGPRGDARDVFQTNFAFARCVRLEAQSVHCGYWQHQHPEEPGFRADQVMRYGESNLNRVQVRGELHVKSGKVLGRGDVPALEAPLELSMLHEQASYEQRAQMSKGSAEDMVEAVLLDAHHAAWLASNPHVRVKESLVQDRLLLDAERTVQRRTPEIYDRLCHEARLENREASKGRVQSDWIEPEPLFWAAWYALSDHERAEVAVEAVSGFAEYVHAASTKDPRGLKRDPMSAHRHRVHPLLWDALRKCPEAMETSSEVRYELRAFEKDSAAYLAKRLPWSPTGEAPPWEAPLGTLGPFSSR